MEGLGHLLAHFQKACHRLYLLSVEGKEAPWLAPMLEAGKPGWLVNAQRSQHLAHTLPRIIRPDLLWCGSSLALAEIDSVPGGLGITLFLSRAYAQAGFPVLGGAEGIADGFRAAHPDGATIAVSEESTDYRPEMEYLASELGSRFRCADAETLPTEGVSGIYRFFELFDTEAIPPAKKLIEENAAGRIRMSPPPIEHLEEKIWLALLHMPGLQHYWRQALRASHLNRLQALIPHGWCADPTPLPPQAVLPWLNLHNWQEIATLSQKERRLVLKISGFSPLAWGGKGVFIGHDMNGKEWEEALGHALSSFPRQLWLLQEFREAGIIEHPFYTPQGTVAVMRGRVRLCPYYFRTPDGRTTLGGCLASIVPADKKKIHGMSEAILTPCISA